MAKQVGSYTKRSLAGISLIFSGVMVVILLIGCRNFQETQSPTSSIATLSATKTIPSNNESQSQEDTEPKGVKSRQTPTSTQNYYNSFAVIDFTQEPIIITTVQPENDTILYENAIVNINTPWKEGDNYLNLDDLSHNEASNGDIIISHSTGSAGTFYHLYTTNGSMIYFSNLHNMDYETCLEHFPFTNLDPFLYTIQGNLFGSGRDYCVLTNQGRLSIVHLIQESLHHQVNETTNLEVVVTTYSQVLPKALNPLPTPTPGPTPTQGRFSGQNLTEKQIEGLNNAAQTFLDAVKAGDKETISNMIDYPLAYCIDPNRNISYANNKIEFLSIYSKILKEDFVKELSEATIEKNFGPYTNSIALIVKDYAVFFYPDGSISEISAWSGW